MILIVSLIYFAKIIGGLALTHLIWDSREPRHLVLKLFLGTGVGFGVSSLLYFIWFLVRFPASQYPYVEFLLFFVLLAINFIKEYKRKNSATMIHWHKPETRTVLWTGLALLAVAISSLSFWLYAIKYPHGLNDAWAIWNSAARFIYLAGDRWLSLLPKNPWNHSDYPLLLSLNIAEGWSIIGTGTTRVPILVAFTFFLSIIGLLFSALAISKNFEQGALAAILIASVPQLPLWASSQLADIPLSYFFLATGALLYLYIITNNTNLVILAGLFAGLSAWTKNEGEMFAIISLCICFVVSVYKRKNLLKHFILGVFFPALVIFFFKTLTPANDLFVNKAKSILQLLDFSRYQIISSKMITFIFSFDGWPISFVGILLIYILLVSTKSEIKEKLWIPVLLCLCQFAGYFVIYLITPHTLVTHIDTSFGRLLFHIFPLTIFWVFNALPSPREVFARAALTKPQDDFEQG